MIFFVSTMCDWHFNFSPAWGLPNFSLATLYLFIWLSLSLLDLLWPLLEEVGWSCFNWRHLWLMIALPQFESIKQADIAFSLHLCCLPSCLSLENTSWSLRRTLSLSWRHLVSLLIATWNVFTIIYDQLTCLVAICSAQLQLNGNCQLKKCNITDGFITYCSSSGLPDDLIQKGKDIKSVSEIQEDGNNFKVTITTGTKVLVNTFIIGQEAELETVTGEKVKVSQMVF